MIGIVCTKPRARVGPLCVFARGGPLCVFARGSRFDVAYDDDAPIEREVEFGQATCFSPSVEACDSSRHQTPQNEHQGLGCVDRFVETSGFANLSRRVVGREREVVTASDQIEQILRLGAESMSESSAIESSEIVDTE